jgi:hypothetical protein
MVNRRVRRGKCRFRKLVVYVVLGMFLLSVRGDIGRVILRWGTWDSGIERCKGRTRRLTYKPEISDCGSDLDCRKSVKLPGDEVEETKTSSSRCWLCCPRWDSPRVHLS